MNWLVLVLIVVPIGGFVIAYFERKRKRRVLDHDTSLDKNGWRLKQQIESTSDAFRFKNW